MIQETGLHHKRAQNRRQRPSPGSTPTNVLRRSALAVQRGLADPGSLTPGDMLTLQRTIGNRAATQMLRPVLQKQDLTLGPADDQYEREADRVAAQVVRQIDGTSVNAPEQSTQQPTVQRDTLDEEEMVQAKRLTNYLTPVRGESLSAAPVTPTFQAIQRQEQPFHGPEGGAVEQSVQQQIQGMRGGGKPLDEDVRNQMESSFSADFSGVRVHTGSQADTLNRSLNARAFTVGNDVFFRGGEYNPGSSSGKQLLAHELTHTIQQGGASAAVQAMTIQRKVKNFSEEKDMKPLLGKIEHYAQYSVFDNLSVEDDPELMSHTRDLYETVSHGYTQLLLKLKQYNQIPLDDGNYQEHIALLEEIQFWIDQTYKRLKELWHYDRTVLGDHQIGGMSDEWKANFRRVKIVKDMNGTLFSALFGSGGRLQKLYRTVDKEKERVQDQARNAPREPEPGWDRAHPSNQSPYYSRPFHAFHNRLAHPEVIPSDQRHFVPRRIQDRSNRSQKTFGSRWQWQDGSIGGPRSGFQIGGNRWQKTEPTWYLPNQQPQMGSHRNLLNLDELDT